MYDGAIMPSRTQVTLEAEQHRRARTRASELGLSLAEYLRRLVDADLGERRSRPDVSSVFDLGRSGGSDVALEKDRYVGEAVEEARPNRHRSG
jgi:hypothetical protein